MISNQLDRIEKGNKFRYCKTAFTLVKFIVILVKLHHEMLDFVLRLSKKKRENTPCLKDQNITLWMSYYMLYYKHRLNHLNMK